MKIVIDYGTSYTRMAYLGPDGKVIFVPNVKNGGGSFLFPSTLEVVTNDTPYIFCYLKTLLDSHQIPFINQKENFPYQISDDAGKLALKSHNGIEWFYEDLMSQTFKEFKMHVDEHVEESVEAALIVVPASMSEMAREKLLNFSRLAGFLDSNLIEADLAAVLRTQKENPEVKKSIVCDFSGGQFSVSVIEAKEGALKRLAVRSDKTIAADGILSLILNWIFEKNPEVRKPYLERMSQDPVFFYDVFKNLEKVKQRLSHQQSVDIELLLPEKEERFKIAFSNYEFARLLEGWLEQIEKLCEETLSSSGVSIEEIDQIVLVGGITRNPVVNAHFKKIFLKTPFADFNPLQIIAEGAVYSLT